jgi:uncharacterized protein DUF551
VKSEWISVKERMPETRERVLIAPARQGGVRFGVDVAIWHGSFWDHPNWSVCAKRDYVSHWQPLPPPPKEQS